VFVLELNRLHFVIRGERHEYAGHEHAGHEHAG